MGPWVLMPSASHGGGDHLDDPAHARPVRLDVIRSFLGPHLPEDLPAKLFALSRCGESDLALALELALDLAAQGFLVAFERQEHFGPLGEVPAKTLAWCAKHPPGSRCPPAPGC